MCCEDCGIFIVVDILCRGGALKDLTNAVQDPVSWDMLSGDGWGAGYVLKDFIGFGEVDTCFVCTVDPAS